MLAFLIKRLLNWNSSFFDNFRMLSLFWDFTILYFYSQNRNTVQKRLNLESLIRFAETNAIQKKANDLRPSDFLRAFASLSNRNSQQKIQKGAPEKFWQNKRLESIIIDLQSFLSERLENYNRL